MAPGGVANVAGSDGVVPNSIDARTLVAAAAARRRPPRRCRQ
jgi:hypothetical protein